MSITEVRNISDEVDIVLDFYNTAKLFYLPDVVKVDYFVYVCIADAFCYGRINSGRCAVNGRDKEMGSIEGNVDVNVDANLFCCDNAF